MRWFKSPAKINRFLHIKAKLASGYHEIVTVFEKIAFFDHVGIELRRDGKSDTKISCPDWLTSGPDNLVYQAVQKFREAAMMDFSVHVELKKHIPAGAGLGGGSSNCGTTLRAVNSMLGEPLSIEALMLLARSIGADCPFFVSDWTFALGTGTGATLEKISLDANWYMLVLPDFAVNTGWAYQNFKLTIKGDETIFEPRKVQACYEWKNDLEGPVCERYPVISRIKSCLLDSGAKTALMSGSGSTVFGVFETMQQALDAVEGVRRDTGYRCLVTKTLDKD